jgi:hypothetical protein
MLINQDHNNNNKEENNNNNNNKMEEIKRIIERNEGILPENLQFNFFKKQTIYHIIFLIS